MKYFIFLSFIFLSISSYSQKFEYSIGAGAHYSGINSLENSNYGAQVFSEINFHLNKRFSISSGIGFKQIKTEIHSSRTAHMTYFSGSNLETTYDDRQPFIVPNSVVVVYNEDSTEVHYVENEDPIVFQDSLDQYWNVGGEIYPKTYYYNIFMLNIPVIVNFKLFNEKLRFRTGISASIPIFANVKEETEYTHYFGDTPYNYTITNNYNSSDHFNFIHLNVCGGIRYHAFEHLIFGLNIQTGITNLKKSSASYIKSLSFNVSYKF